MDAYRSFSQVLPRRMEGFPSQPDVDASIDAEPVLGRLGGQIARAAQALLKALHEACFLGYSTYDETLNFKPY